ncbi:hypothetical protein [Photobacterium lutimaris]|uniref:Uncharacterized protein n=1 Tax=Photobacterium lutimaris TaxID=388278 RepID=A0A2T3ITU4_9GAMM|nr:hypothetical protein [Photobacterium lutimaris]PSU31768.1 hypothetical protein C9I99_21530 [Photobacterium lutimaris]TDR72581.1 hypothetical protein DFP78_11357 [Photobacterium lutimaris]
MHSNSNMNQQYPSKPPHAPVQQPAPQSAPMTPVQPVEDYSKTQIQLYLGSAIQFKQRVSSGKKGLLTVYVEIAPFKQGQNRVGDWARSIKFQLTPDTETVQFAHLLMGRLPGVDFKFHGEDRSKSLKANWNEDGTLFLGINEGKNRSFVKMPPTAIFAVMTLTIKVIAQRHGINTSSALEMLRMMPPATA